MSKFKKGDKKPANSGREAGVPNKKTQQWLLFEEYMLNAGLKKFEAELSKLQGKDFIVAVSNMMEFFKPKLQRTEIEGEITNKQVIVKRPEK